MSDRAIIFSGPMVRAILEGRKSQTRRIVRGLDRGEALYWDKGAGCWGVALPSTPVRPLCCPYGAPNDRLWIRETWAPAFALDDGAGGAGYLYRATNRGPEPSRWRPAIFMPRAASRITLAVTGIRVERLQAISEADALAEGMVGSAPGDTFESARDEFAAGWDRINGKRAPWADNSWVWVVSFHVAWIDNGHRAERGVLFPPAPETQ